MDGAAPALEPTARRRRARRRRPVMIWLGLAVVLAAFLAACGDDYSSTSASNSTTSASESSETTGSAGGSPPVSLSGQVNDHGTKALSGDKVEVELDNFYFEPTYVAADGGKTVKVELKNDGDTAHTFTIDGTDIDVVLQPGDKQTVEVELPDSGQLVYYCRFHQSQGMQGGFAVNS